MPGSLIKESSHLPALRPASGISVTHATAAVGGPTCAAATASFTSVTNSTMDGVAAAQPDSSGYMMGEVFEEDWQRPPGDLAYLQDLFASLDGQRHASPPQTQTLATASTTTTTTATPVSTTAGKSVPAGRRGGDGDGAEEEDVAGLWRREQQLRVIERRRRRAQCRCDAVEAAFARSVERRMRAMQHLAIDPPAERLVGQGTAQYVPAALLPDDLLDAEARLRPEPLPLLPHSVVETHMLQRLTSGADVPHSVHTATSQPVAAITDGAAHRPHEADALVFLTQLDAGKAPEKGGQARSTGSDSHHPQQQTSSKNRSETPAASLTPPVLTENTGAEGPLLQPEECVDDDEGDDEDWMRPANVTAANKDRWRELGYRVVVVGGGEAESHSCGGAPAASSTSSASKRAAASSGGAQSQGTATATTARASLWRRTPTSRLPPVCLVQRRLPEEDMTAAELRARQPTTKRAAFRRGDSGSAEGRHWKMSEK